VDKYWNQLNKDREEELAKSKEVLDEYRNIKPRFEL
jgi:hypothetical protein